jgi:3-deoxy-D-manno-octulosonic-acid transferase
LYALYSFLYTLGFLFGLPYFLWKGRGTGKYAQSFCARLLGPALEERAGPCIWIHAVSVGEALAARVLVPELRRRWPGHALCVSTVTPTGQAVAASGLAGQVDGVFYAPFDWAFSVRRALEVVRPELLLLVETEIWPNLIRQARRRGVRVALVNGRISPRSFPRYRRIRPFLARVLGEVDLFLMQSEPHAERLRALGAPPERVRVGGNLKFDSVGAAAPSAELAGLLGAADPARPLLVAGSTMAGEEEAVLAAFLEVRARVAGARLLVAPRHPERFDEVERLVKAAGVAVARRSRLAGAAWGAEPALLLDTMGELAQCYGLASLAFVGGSLVPRGGHNVLEAALAGTPVVVGPHMENFEEIAEALRAAGALVQVQDAEALAAALLDLMGDADRRRELGERGRRAALAERGASARTAALVRDLLG